MDCTQDNDLMPLLLELGILPCLGLMLLIVGLFYIVVKHIGREKSEPYTDDEAICDFLAFISSTIMFVAGIAFLAGAILINILNSGLTRQPIHWF